MYTNISFTEKQREDEFKIYNNLKSNGFFELFYQALDENEYNELFTQLNTIRKEKTKENRSVTSIINKFINDLPSNAEAAAKIVENFNPEQFKNVMEFAKYANGGRDIK